jgi:hypothetical protein
VYTPEQILDRGARPSGKVIVLDDEGLNTGVGVAQVLAESGADVELMTRWLMPVAEQLIYTFEFAFVLPTLKHAGIKVSRETYIKEIGDRQVTAFDVFTNIEHTIADVDAIVLVTARMPENALVKELEGKVGQLFEIGDASAARALIDATYEGHKFARLIGEENAPANFAEAFWQRVPRSAFPSPAAPPATPAMTP